MRALVLSGGGAKGAFQVGAVQHLLGELRREYDIYTGISVGALNSAFLAMYRSGMEEDAAAELAAVWSTVNDARIYRPRYPVLGKTFSAAFSALSSPALYDSKPLQDLVHHLLVPGKVQASGKILRVGAVSINTGEKRYWGEDSPDIAEAVIASSAFPGFFIPGYIDGDVWTDGGVRDVAPIQQAIELGATEVDVVVTSPEGLRRIDAGNLNVISGAQRILDSMSEEIMETDLIIGSYVGASEGHTVRILRPSRIVQPDPLDFNQEKIQENIAHGLEEARKVDWNA